MKAYKRTFSQPATHICIAQMIRTESHNELYAADADFVVSIIVLTIVAHSNIEIKEYCMSTFIQL